MHGLFRQVGGRYSARTAARTGMYTSGWTQRFKRLMQVTAVNAGQQAGSYFTGAHAKRRHVRLVPNRAFPV
jgi:hypothetical protein